MHRTSCSLARSHTLTVLSWEPVYNMDPFTVRVNTALVCPCIKCVQVRHLSRRVSTCFKVTIFPSAPAASSRVTASLWNTWPVEEFDFAEDVDELRRKGGQASDFRSSLSLRFRWVTGKIVSSCWLEIPCSWGGTEVGGGMSLESDGFSFGSSCSLIGGWPLTEANGDGISLSAFVESLMCSEKSNSLGVAVRRRTYRKKTVKWLVISITGPSIGRTHH